MSSVVSSTPSAKLTVGLKNTTATIYHIDMATLGNEYSQALPANTIGFMLSGRTLFKMKLAYTVNGTQGLDYKTIQAGVTFTDDNYYQSQTIYLSSDTNNTTAELICWSIIP